MKKAIQITMALLAASTIGTACSKDAPAKNQQETHSAAQPSVKKPVPEAAALPTLARTVKINDRGVAEVTNMTDMLVVVNKKRTILPTYTPPDLIQPNIPFSFPGKSPRKLMRKQAAHALEQLFAQAKKDKVDLLGQSAYRSYATQKAIFDENAKEKGEAVANKTSAIPGESEHQTGLAIDLTSHRVGFSLEENFGATPEGKWLAKNAPHYGFIIRYPKGKEKITGYSYEPWHIRYVGVKIAEEISAKGITLEEYLSR
ncbi:M15 family metallopeptidase [Aneurinibacillus sp. Ricciae_BoGa-3]|uniref:M15 family metallopeptidase n=1 Tax=Aneurinibacillus sp. Ricciae_BoGa-3 TaxID=3022697 RepID=UPI0023411AC5|nr:M15 family metallopeptidase [Aneurinibacillus sp. Ricciae_BoGa-3]WCK53551.1 M15 family metallopeptidase [Aneurinibacillus sp. Ricciae_BoGa-3]